MPPVGQAAARRSRRSARSALGVYCRRISARTDKGEAVAAAAHKLARPACLMLSRGEESVDQGRPYAEERRRERVVRKLRPGLSDKRIGSRLRAIYPYSFCVTFGAASKLADA